MRVIGLTGSIGMGKSTALAFFAEEGCAVWDADSAVHRLYARDGGMVADVEALFPGVTAPGGGIDRAALAERLRHDPTGFSRLEAVVHPRVRDDREDFLRAARDDGVDVAVVDVPLLFETGGQTEVDVVVVVSAPAEVQRRRVLARPGMTEARFAQILARQVPDASKRAQADFVIDTRGALEDTRSQVRAILDELSASTWQSGRLSGLHTEPEQGE